MPRSRDRIDPRRMCGRMPSTGLVHAPARWQKLTISSIRYGGLSVISSPGRLSSLHDLAFWLGVAKAFRFAPQGRSWRLVGAQYRLDLSCGPVRFIIPVKQF